MEKMNLDFAGKAVLVTGASSGIGRETAIRFAAHGARVMVSDVNEDLGANTAHVINEAGGRAFFFPCDVAQPERVRDLVKEAARKMGRLDVACNNAGVEGIQNFTADCPLENWRKIIDVNLKGVFLCMKYQIPEMLKNGGGAIVNISSIAGLIGFPGLPAYVASKHGVIGLTRTAALEYSRQNIRVNAVCPGPILTPMLERIMSASPDFKENLLAGVPQHRIGEVSEVADTILFLCSKAASYITGQAVAVDGGWVAQ